MEIKDIIYSLMKANNISNIELAKKIGMPVSSINTMFAYGYFSEKMLKKIGIVFDTDLTPFITYLDEENIEKKKQNMKIYRARDKANRQRIY